MTWQLVYTKQAQEDAKKIASAGLKSKAVELLEILQNNPFQNPPPYEKLVGELFGEYSRRLNIQHRLVYQEQNPSQLVGRVPELLRCIACAGAFRHCCSYLVLDNDFLCFQKFCNCFDGISHAATSRDLKIGMVSGKAVFTKINDKNITWCVQQLQGFNIIIISIINSGDENKPGISEYTGCLLYTSPSPRD